MLRALNVREEEEHTDDQGKKTLRKKLSHERNRHIGTGGEIMRIFLGLISVVTGNHDNLSKFRKKVTAILPRAHTC